MKKLTHLHPLRVFHYFEEICGIPHGSGDTGRISDYCVAFAKDHDLWYRQDALGNVLIKKAATPGYEEHPTVILQGHLDMVCEKCGARMIQREGRYGKFAACPNYPKCKNTKRLETKEEAPASEEERQPEIVADDPCPVCGGEMIARKGAFGTFFACRKYPDCKGSMPFYRDSGIPCPECGKRILIKQTRKHKTYYCCEKYPECSFSSWDAPTGEKCPGCGSPLLRKKGKGTVYCKSGCGYSEGK